MVSTSANVTVLLAEDHTLIAEGLARILAEKFNLIARVEDGARAVAECKRMRPNVAVLDIAMPGMTGIEAARQILADLPKTKIVFLTMHSDPTYVREAMRAGGSAFVLKRSAVSELEVAIH